MTGGLSRSFDHSDSPSERTQKNWYPRYPLGVLKHRDQGDGVFTDFPLLGESRRSSRWALVAAMAHPFTSLSVSARNWLARNVARINRRSLGSMSSAKNDGGTAVSGSISKTLPIAQAAVILAARYGAS